MPFALKQSDRLRAPRSHFVETPHEVVVLERLVAFSLSLRDHVVAEEFMVAKEIGGGLLVILSRPTAVVVLKIGGFRVGEIVGGESYIVVELDQVVGIRELV